MFGFEAILKTIPLSKGVGLITHHLENQLKISIEKYDLLFDAKDKNVSFEVYHDSYENGKKKFPFKSGEKFINVALHYLKDKIPKGSEIDKAMIQVSPDGITAYLFYTKDGEKNSFKHKF